MKNKFRYLTVKTWAKEAGITRTAVYAKINGTAGRKTKAIKRLQ